MKTYKKILIAFAVLTLIGAGFGYKYYNFIYSSNVNLEKESIFFYIPTGSSFEDVVKSMEQAKILNNIESFKWVSARKKYDKLVKPGKYKIKNNWSNNQLVNMLRLGAQTPVKVTYNNTRFLSELAGVLSRNMESDSLTFIKAFQAEAIYKKYNFTKENFISMFIPNTYEFFWNTSPEKFIERIHEEYVKFWNTSRKAKLDEIGLNKLQVSILASIVDMEIQHVDEMPRVAGVYVNRFKQDWKLEADPTLKYAVGDFTIKRVLNKHKEVNSPYNTYMYKGLPPGPICMPTVQAIDAVLNYERHEYMFFCARPDFSGYHNFAKNMQQHQANAKFYQSDLDRRGIR